MAAYGRQFYDKGGKKITLNFALSTESILDPVILKQHFDPDIFLIKLTPINPTFSAKKNKIKSSIRSQEGLTGHPHILQSLQDAGYEVIISIGELEENLIGSNCGQYIQTMLRNGKRHEDSYCYPLREV
jgi:23S rRNA (adenine2503-C2)-methyltransferase